MTAVSRGDLPANLKEQAQWTLHRLLPGRGICNIGFTLAVDQPLRWWPLQESLSHLLRRHPALRAVLYAEGTALRKRYLPADTVLPLETLAGTEGGLDARLTDLVAIPFDVAAGPLVRAHLVVLPRRSVLAVVLHHAVCDLMSASVLVRELTELYGGFAEQAAPPPALAGTAGLFLEPDPEPEAVRYWVELLRGVDPRRQPLDSTRPAPPRQTFAGGAAAHQLSGPAVDAVAKLRTLTRTTENVVLLAAYCALLARHGAGPLLAVGVPVNARRGGVAPDVVGYHTNTLPLCVDVDLGAGFVDLARVAGRAFLAGLENGTVSFEAMRPALDIRSEDWRLPLFRYMFNYVPREPSGLRLNGYPAEASDVYHGMSRVDLELHVNRCPGHLLLDAVYSTEAHRHEDVVALLERYEALLVTVAAVPDRPIGALDVRSAADHALETRTNATTRHWPETAILSDVVAAATAATRSPAVGDWTYERLLAAADRIGAACAEQGVRRGDAVGVYAIRGPVAAAAILGTWLAGAAYLPMDPAHPAGRAAAELDDAGVRVMVGDRTPPPECAAGRVVVRADDVAERGEAPATTPGLSAAAAIGPDDLAYVIYTSGSTGRPKGVEVSHRGLANVVRHFAKALGASAADRALWVTTCSFDISALELLVPLTVGGQVVVASDDLRRDPAALLRAVVADDVTVLQATPTLWRQVAGRLGGELRGRRVLCGGEPLTPPLAQRLLADGCRLFNAYGPTETTIWSTCAEVTGSGDAVPIGRPIANTGVHVLDPNGRPVPPGLPGELWITGAGLARGYRGDPDGTARRFVADPVLGRRYGTGDVVRQRADGRLEFLGRVDRQVKVRGHRVELAEVETLLERHPQVALAAVFTEPDPDGQPRLAAVVQPVDGAAEPDRELPVRLRHHLAGQLPDAFVPSRLVVADVPLTDNGKVDYRAAMAVVCGHAGADEPEAPQDPTVRRLVRLWRQVLADPRLGATANFFLSGGHSLLAFDLAERVSAEMCQPVTFEMVFADPTPARLAARLSGGAS